MLAEVRVARTADVAKMLTELKGHDSTISFLWMHARWREGEDGGGGFRTKHVLDLKSARKQVRATKRSQCKKETPGERPLHFANYL